MLLSTVTRKTATTTMMMMLRMMMMLPLMMLLLMMMMLLRLADYDILYVVTIGAFLKATFCGARSSPILCVIRETFLTMTFWQKDIATNTILT